MEGGCEELISQPKYVVTHHDIVGFTRTVHALEE